MIEKIVITALIVMAIWATMWEDAIFDFIRKWGEAHITGKYEKWQKPLYDCPICMTPYYGSVVYWLIWKNNWIEWLIVIIAAMGLNAVLVKLFPEE